jgi:hypothetical protein
MQNALPRGRNAIQATESRRRVHLDGASSLIPNHADFVSPVGTANSNAAQFPLAIPGWRRGDELTRSGEIGFHDMGFHQHRRAITFATIGSPRGQLAMAGGACTI